LTNLVLLALWFGDATHVRMVSTDVATTHAGSIAAAAWAVPAGPAELAGPVA
jgi:hypothetical protein